MFKTAKSISKEWKEFFDGLKDKKEEIIKRQMDQAGQKKEKIYIKMVKNLKIMIKN